MGEHLRLAALHDISGFGRGSMTTAIAVSSAAGVQCCPVVGSVLSAHTAYPQVTVRDLTEDLPGYIDSWQRIGCDFDALYSGYMSHVSQGEQMLRLLEKSARPGCLFLVDPVMGDNGKAYSTVTSALIDRMRGLCRRADLILPNATEAALLLEREPQTDAFDDASAQALADELLTLAPSAVVTGLALGKYIGCAGSGRERFVIKKLHISRSFPGTGDLYGAVLIGSLIQGNALSAAADNAAEFVSLAIQQTPADQDTRYGVWFEPLLPRLCPVSWND